MPRSAFTLLTDVVPQLKSSAVLPSQTLLTLMLISAGIPAAWYAKLEESMVYNPKTSI